MRDRPATREPLAGAELREAARFAMTLVTEQAKVCQRILRLLDLGFPELGKAYEDPTCASALAVLRAVPRAAEAARRRTSTIAEARTSGPYRTHSGRADPRPGPRPIAPPQLAEQVGFEMRLLIAQHDLLEQQTSEAEARVAAPLDGELARRLRTIPGVGPAITATLIAEIGDIRRFDDFDKARRLRRDPPGGAQLGPQGRRSRDQLAHVQSRQRLPARGALPHGRRRPAAQSRDQGALRAQAGSRPVEDERPRPLHEEGSPSSGASGAASTTSSRRSRGLDNWIWDRMRLAASDVTLVT